MRVADKVAWAEGVLLLPQHFQQLDRYHEQLLGARLHALEPANWGALRLELDLRALEQGVVSLLEFEGIMPDGTPLNVGPATGTRAPKPRPVGEHFPPAQSALAVYLALPLERSGVNNYGNEAEALRWSLNQQKLCDASRDDRQAEVQLAVPNLRLLFGDESRAGCTTLRVAELVRDASGTLTVSPSYIPPILRASASPVLNARLEQLLRRGLSRLRFLSEARRVTGESRVEFTTADVTRYLQLNALNTMVPSLHYLARSREASPRSAFLVLSQFAGQLATFVPDADMSEPLDFDFSDLTTTFGALFELCDYLLAASDNERFVSASLTLRDGGRHFADLKDVRLDKCERFLLAVESSLPRPLVTEELTQRGKVASHSDIEFVLTKNVGGVALRESKEPPSVLPLKPGLIYFELPDPSNDVYFRHVQQDRNIVVWIPNSVDASKLTIKLVGVFGSRA